MVSAVARPLIDVQGLCIGAGNRVLQRDLTFQVLQGEVLAIIGASGCGKSTLLRHLLGLQAPLAGHVHLDAAFGVSFQAGALWSSMTVGENVMLPMELHGALPPAEREAQARFKLALVGLGDAFDAEPSALSGGMRKRAAIARALALDPALLLLDEPGAGLDPPSAARLDELLLTLREHLGTTVVLVTHELASIFRIADRALFLDVETKTMTALDAPRTLAERGPPAVRAFLHREARAA